MFKKWLERFTWIALLIAFWEVVRLVKGSPALIQPSFFSVVKALGHSLLFEQLFLQIILSLLLVISGIFIGLGLAFLLSFISLRSKKGESLVRTINALFHPLPGIALLPVVILWFGTGVKSVLFIIVHSVLWPLVTNLNAGYRSMPEAFTLVARNYEIRTSSLFTRIFLPATSPYLIAGLKIAWARGWRALISAEMVFGAIGGSGGVGWFIFNKRVFMDTSGLFAGILVVIIIGILVEDILFHFLEKATVEKWGMSL